MLSKSKKKDKEEVNVSSLKTFVIEETKYKTNINKKFENRKPWSKPPENQIFSVIPGLISKVYVKENDHVNKGDKLLVLEAMKMKNTIKVPVSGIVTKVNVEEGQNVPKGLMMIELETDIVENEIEGQPESK